ncbi:MAG: hypothetical protein IH845_04645 [Nanoarchaeota archaeon]|nr:hypothetical protein [Nanoarchaeota archaeon]
MDIIDYANFGAGFFKGFMNLHGPEFDVIYFGSFVLGSSFISGASKVFNLRRTNGLECRLEESASYSKGLRAAGNRMMTSSVELGIGYGVGLATQSGLTYGLQRIFMT